MLIRVAFVVLTIFGGFGLLLYVLGWLLLPADGDEVSPGEVAAGSRPILRRRRSWRSAWPSSRLISILSMFSWGLPFWPLVIVGSRRDPDRSQARAGECTGRQGQTRGVGRTIGQPRSAEAGHSWGEQAEQWVARQPWSGSGESARAARQPSNDRRQRRSPAQSPFDKPAFWDEPTPRTASRVNLRKDDGAAEPGAGGPPHAAGLGSAGRRPLRLGPARTRRRSHRPRHPGQRSVIGRITLGMVLLVGGLATVGIFAGLVGPDLGRGVGRSR